MTDIYTKLSSEHRTVSKLLGQLAETGAVDPEKRAALFPTLKKELLLHSKAEEATFYEALRGSDKTRDKINHSKKEHDEVENLLKELSSMDTASAQWGERILKVQSMVEHHVREEEGEIFPRAKEMLNDAQARDLAMAFDREKQRHAASV